MKLNKAVISIVSLSIISSTMAHAQLKPGLRPGQPPPPGHLVPGPPGGGAVVQPPPAPVKKELDQRRMEEIVRRAAENYVRDVLEIVGEAYNVRYNLRRGLLRARNIKGDYELISNIKASSQYRNSLEEGKRRGLSDGASAGLGAANNTGYSMADTDIGKDVDSAIDNKAPIVFKPNPRSVSFNGVESSRSQPGSFINQLLGDRSSRESRILNLMYNRHSMPYELRRFATDLNAAYREDNTLVPDGFRYENALNNFLNNSLNTSSSIQSDARQYYREITNGAVYATPEENRRVFVTSFLMAYSRGIEYNWNQRVQSTNSSALNLGESFYNEEADELADQWGLYDGHRETHRGASIQSFNDNIIGAYNRHYATIKNKVETSSHITQIQAAIVPEQDGRTEFTVGDTFDVVLSSITNRGMVSADVKIDILTSGNVKTMGYPQTIHVDGLTRINTPNRYVRLGWLSEINSPDADITVIATVGSQQISARFKQTFEEAIRRIVSTPDAGTSKWLMDKMVGFMSAEYLAMDRGRNAPPLLARMAAVFSSMSDEQKNKLRENGQVIRNIYGGKPSKFLGLNPKRDQWEKAQELINQMALPGSTPKDVVEPPQDPFPPGGGGGA